MSEKSEKAKMLAGELYRSADPELVEDVQRAQRLLREYNAIPFGDTGAAMALLRRLLGSVGDGTVLRPFFACDYGYNIRLGINAFINFNCVFLDCAPIEIGDHVLLGPGVHLYAATHPLDAAERRGGLELAKPISVGDDAWLGGGTIVLPGVTIGARAVVGAGSVVTRDISADARVAGNPARPIGR